ncbi:MAG: hypothetical protein NT023_20980 [Armatimonadetes bacterium]|nr:hypothetical protein [Armatimonadota bacterium]
MPTTYFKTSRRLFRIGLAVALLSVALPNHAIANNAPKTPPAKQTKVPFWTSDAGAHTVPATDASILSSPSLSKEDRALVRWCLARYGLPGVYADQEVVERAAERAAKRFFDRMPSAEIARRLTPIRKALYRGTRAYTSVSFVLAYYGIDFEKNALRVVESLSLMILDKPSKLKLAGLASLGQDSGGAEGVPAAVTKLYARNQSASLLRAYLHSPADGTLMEDKCWTLGGFFLKYPAQVLQAAATPRDMESLAFYAYEVSDDHRRRRGRKVWRILDKLEGDNDAIIVRLAKRFRKVYAREVAEH